jgi:hypothetical protein
MKPIFIFLILFSFLHSQAQQTKKDKILIGYNFSSDYNYRTLKNNDGKASNDGIIWSRNEFEIFKFGYSTGLNLCFNASKNWAFETGIQYSNNGYKTKSLDLSFEIPDDASPSKVKFIYSYQYLGIPIKAKYFFGKKNIRFVSGVGVLTNFLVNAKTKIKSSYLSGREENKTELTKSNFKKINILPLISFGVDYKMCRNIHLMAEPTFRYSLINTKSAPITENLWNMGVNIGIYYDIK